MTKKATSAKLDEEEAMPLDNGDTQVEEIQKEQPAPPVLPTVGHIVHYYTKDRGRQYHQSEGPYAALVTRVDELPQVNKDDPLTAIVSLMVFPGGDAYVRPYSALDVPGVSPDADHSYQSWWMWPEKV